MKHRFKLWQVILAGVNAACIIAALILTALGGTAAKRREYDRAAERWSGGKGGFTQLCAFFTGDSGFNTSSLGSLRAGIHLALQDASVAAEEGRTLVPDAYSAELGSYGVQSSGSSRAEAQVTAVGGDFFLFRSFELLSGAFFTEEDIMQDGAVIDSELAWELYGSDDIAGMDIYIGGVKFYIAGVTALPRDKTEKKCAGDTRRVYISYDGAGNIEGSSYAGSSYSDPDMPPVTELPGFSRIDCYECIIPEPVKNFAESTLKKQLKPAYKGKYELVVNSKRYHPSVLKKAKLTELAVRKIPLAFPYWENASRITEARLRALYAARKIVLILPVLTALLLIIKGYILLKRSKPRIKAAAAGAFDKLRSRGRKRNTTT